MNQEKHKPAIFDDRPVWDGLPWKFVEPTSQDSIGVGPGVEHLPTLAEYAAATGRISAEIDAMRANAGVFVGGEIGSADVAHRSLSQSIHPPEETNYRKTA